MSNRRLLCRKGFLHKDRFMPKTIITLLEEIVSNLDRDTLLLVGEAKLLSDRYLAWWNPKREMKLILKQPSETHRQAKTGLLRPMVRQRKNISKWYLEWSTEGCHITKRINKSWAKPITPTKVKGYTRELLLKNSDDWELEKAWELEEYWKPIRTSLNSLHKAKVDILKQIKRLKDNDDGHTKIQND